MASRDLDSQVAERVMGLGKAEQRLGIQYTDDPEPGEVQDMAEESRAQGLGGLYDQAEPFWFVPGSGSEPDWRYLQHYSTSIAAAWEVVERMRERGSWLNLEFADYPQHGESWHAEFADHDSRQIGGICDGEACAPTAPEAICRAALSALEETDA